MNCRKILKLSSPQGLKNVKPPSRKLKIMSFALPIRTKIEIERKSDEIAREKEKERERELCDWNRDIEKLRELRERIERMEELRN